MKHPRPSGKNYHKMNVDMNKILCKKVKIQKGNKTEIFKINNSICQTETVDISKTGFRKKKKYTRKKQTNKKT